MTLTEKQKQFLREALPHLSVPWQFVEPAAEIKKALEKDAKKEK